MADSNVFVEMDVRYLGGECGIDTAYLYANGRAVQWIEVSLSCVGCNVTNKKGVAFLKGPATVMNNSIDDIGKPYKVDCEVFDDSQDIADSAEPGSNKGHPNNTSVPQKTNMIRYDYKYYWKITTKGSWGPEESSKNTTLNLAPFVEFQNSFTDAKFTYCTWMNVEDASGARHVSNRYLALRLVGKPFLRVIMENRPLINSEGTDAFDSRCSGLIGFYVVHDDPEVYGNSPITCKDTPPSTKYKPNNYISNSTFKYFMSGVGRTCRLESALSTVARFLWHSTDPSSYVQQMTSTYGDSRYDSQYTYIREKHWMVGGSYYILRSTYISNVYTKTEDFTDLNFIDKPLVECNDQYGGSIKFKPDVTFRYIWEENSFTTLSLEIVTKSR